MMTIKTKLIKSPPKPAFIASGVLVNNSIFPNECTRNGKISAIAKAAPWITA